MPPVVSIEPLPACERSYRAGLNAIVAEVLGMAAPAVPAWRVTVRDCYAVKDELKAVGYAWEPDTKAWWTALEDGTTLDTLQALARRVGFELRGLPQAQAQARRALSAPGALPASPPRPAAPAAAAVATPSPVRPPRSGADAAAASPATVRSSLPGGGDGAIPAAAPRHATAPAPAPGGDTSVYVVEERDGTTAVSGATGALEGVLRAFGFTQATKPPRWVLARPVRDAPRNALRDAALARGLRFVQTSSVADAKFLETLERNAAPAAAGAAAPQPPSRSAPPRCGVHDVACVLRTAGVTARPHNHGRSFWCCPQQTEQTRDRCAWLWADGTAAYGAEAQARFHAWEREQGAAGAAVMGSSPAGSKRSGEESGAAHARGGARARTDA